MPMGMGAEIDRYSVCEERDIGAVIDIKATQKILVGFPCSARLLYGKETGN